MRKSIKILSLILALCVIFVCASCANNNDTSTTTTTTQDPQPVQADYIKINIYNPSNYNHDPIHVQNEEELLNVLNTVKPGTENNFVGNYLRIRVSFYDEYADIDIESELDIDVSEDRLTTFPNYRYGYAEFSVSCTTDDYGTKDWRLLDNINAWVSNEKIKSVTITEYKITIEDA